MDIYETREEVVYIFEIPGTDSEQVEVELEGSSLLVSAPILTINPQEASYRYQERPKGNLRKIATLVPDVDTERVQAEIKHGLLELRFPKVSGEKRGKKINVTPHPQ